MNISAFFFLLLMLPLAACESPGTKKLKSEFNRLQYLIEKNKAGILHYKQAYTNLKNSGKDQEASLKFDSLMKANEYGWRLVDSTIVIYDELIK